MGTAATEIRSENDDSNPLTGVDALRTGAGWGALTETGWIAVTGNDRVRWLNGMVTNSVKALTPGEGAYCFLLNAQGRIQGDGTVWCEPERLLIETEAAQVEGMVALLDRFIIMDEVELEDTSTAWYGLQAAGPKAAEALASIGLPAKNSRLLKRNSCLWNGHNLVVVNAYSPLVPRFEVWSSDDAAIASLGAALNTAGVSHCDAATFEELRLLEARPLFGADIRDRDLPQETAQDRALHFNKGCYLGQEIVERIRSRGRVHRTFTSFRLLGTVPAIGTELLAEEKPVGVLTSISAHSAEGATLALGYVRQEALERGLPLTYAGGTAEALGPPHASNAENPQ